MFSSNELPDKHILKNEQNKNELDIIGLAKLRQQFPFNPLIGYLNINFLDHKVDSLREFLKISPLEIIRLTEFETAEPETICLELTISNKVYIIH